MGKIIAVGNLKGRHGQEHHRREPRLWSGRADGRGRSDRRRSARDGHGMAARRTAARAASFVAAARRRCRERPHGPTASVPPAAGVRIWGARSAAADGRMLRGGAADRGPSGHSAHASRKSICACDRAGSRRVAPGAGGRAGGRPSCLLVPEQGRPPHLGRAAGARPALVRLGWQVGAGARPARGAQRRLQGRQWIGAHAPGTAAHLEVHALVRAVEDQLARCQEPADPYAPDSVDAGAGMPPAAGLECRPGAPHRIGAFCLGLMGAMLSKLRPGEQQAFH